MVTAAAVLAQKKGQKVCEYGTVPGAHGKVGPVFVVAGFFCPVCESVCCSRPRLHDTAVLLMLCLLRLRFWGLDWKLN